MNVNRFSTLVSNQPPPYETSEEVRLRKDTNTGSTSLRDDITSLIPLSDAIKGASKTPANPLKGMWKEAKKHPGMTMLDAIDVLPVVGMVGALKDLIKVGKSGMPLFSRAIRSVMNNIPKKGTPTNYLKQIKSILDKRVQQGKVGGEERDLVLAAITKYKDSPTKVVMDKGDVIKEIKKGLPSFETKTLNKWGDRYHLGNVDKDSEGLDYIDSLIKYNRPATTKGHFKSSTHWPNELNVVTHNRLQVLPVVNKKGHKVNINLEAQSDPAQAARATVTHMNQKGVGKVLENNFKLQTTLFTPTDKFTKDNIVDALDVNDFDSVRILANWSNNNSDLSNKSLIKLELNGLIKWNTKELGKKSDYLRKALPEWEGLFNSKGFKQNLGNYNTEIDSDVIKLAEANGINLIPYFPFMKRDDVNRLNVTDHIDRLLKSNTINPDGSLTIGVITPDQQLRWWDTGHEAIYGKKGDTFKSKPLAKQGLLLKMYEKVLKPYMKVNWGKTSISKGFKYKDQGISRQFLERFSNNVGGNQEARANATNFFNDLDTFLTETFSTKESVPRIYTSTELFTVFGETYGEILMSAAKRNNAIMNSIYVGKRIKKSDFLDVIKPYNGLAFNTDITTVENIKEPLKWLETQGEYVDFYELRKKFGILTENALHKAEPIPIKFKGKLLKPYNTKISSEEVNSFTIPKEIVEKLKKEGLPYMGILPLTGLNKLSDMSTNIQNSKLKKEGGNPKVMLESLGRLPLESAGVY